MVKDRFPRPNIIGTPRQKYQDFYFTIMDSSWWVVLWYVFFLFLTFNLCFASLYYLFPGSVANVRDYHFWDAFFFSVQTMSTIGFGSMHPISTSGHVIVTIESLFSLSLIALATGIMFAKASRPQASMLFSKPAVITKMHNVPTLMFRVGNARGNDVIDASIDLTALIDEVTPEGHHIRRAVDVPLTRQRTPFFALSWSLMHIIEESSPLYGLDLSNGDKLLYLMVTIKAHDGTYGQTIYSRHTYYPEDIREGERFEDVISRDGRTFTVDYTKFHETKKEEV
jgi:inward rectifier potassium channel